LFTTAPWTDISIARRVEERDRCNTGAQLAVNAFHSPLYVQIAGELSPLSRASCSLSSALTSGLAEAAYYGKCYANRGVRRDDQHNSTMSFQKWQALCPPYCGRL